MRKGTLMLLLVLLTLSAFPAQAGYNELNVNTGGKGAVVYTKSTGKIKAGILYNGYVSSLSLDDENGLYSCWLTRDMTVWVDQDKAHDGWPESYWEMSAEEENSYPCQMYMAQVIQADAPVYTSPSHSHLSATHAKGTLLRVCGEFGDDYFVEGWHGDGFIPKSAVEYYAPLQRSRQYDATYGLPTENRRVYTSGGSLAISGSATGYCDSDPWVVKGGEEVQVLKYLDGWAQLAKGGFIETRFLEENGDHTIRYATVKSSELLDRLNVRYQADKDSRVTVKLCAGARVQVPCHTDTWASVYITGEEGGAVFSGSAMMEYLVFDGEEDVKSGCTRVRLTKDIQGNDAMAPTEYRQGWKGRVLEKGTEMTVVGVESNNSTDTPWGDRFVCMLEDGRLAVIWNGEGILEPVEKFGIHAKANTHVRMREKAGTDSNALRTLSSGARVEVLLRGELWTMVQYKDQVGYVMSRYLNFP